MASPTGDPTTTLRLTDLTDCGGCAAKLGADLLADALAGFGGGAVPDALLVGLEPPDDAAAYLVAPDLAILGTLDFFPPLVDDPETFGAIAAANAVSDIFAMGGRVLFALSIAAFPEAFHATRSPRSSRAPPRRSGKRAAPSPAATRSATRSRSTAWP